MALYGLVCEGSSRKPPKSRQKRYEFSRRAGDRAVAHRQFNVVLRQAQGQAPGPSAVGTSCHVSSRSIERSGGRAGGAAAGGRHGQGRDRAGNDASRAGAPAFSTAPALLPAPGLILPARFCCRPIIS